MEKYTFSITGKIEAILKLVLPFGIIIVLLFIISKVIPLSVLKLVIWLLILWLAYSVFSGIIYICTTTFVIDEKGLAAKAALGITKKVFWNDIGDIKVARHKSRILRVEIFERDRKRPFLILDHTINNHSAMFEKILNYHKKSLNTS